MNSVKDIPLGNSFLIFGPKFNKNNIGAAVPNAYPITAPIPPQVAAEAGPNNIQAPKAEADKLVVREKILSFLSPTMWLLLSGTFFKFIWPKIIKKAPTIRVIINVIVEDKYIFSIFPY